MKEVTKDRNFFKVNRSILSWEWFEDAKTLQVWIYLLANAAYTDKKWRGIEIGVGDVITSRKKIASDCGMSEQNVRTCLKRLKSTNEITIKSTKHYSRITLTNFAEYQGIKIENKAEVEETETTESTNAQPTTNQQLTNNISKKVKKEKKDDDDLGTLSPRARTDSKLKLQLENDIERLRSLAKKHKVNDGVIADMIEPFYDWYSSCREDAKNYTYLCTAFDNWLHDELKRNGGDDSPAAEPDPIPTPPTDNQPAEQPSEPKKFVKPTIEEVDAEIKRRGYTDIDPVTFWNFYESKGWKVGNQPMKKWQACLTTWHKRESRQQGQQNKQQNGQSSNLPAPTRSRSDESVNWQCATVKTRLTEAEERRRRKLAALDEEGGFSTFEEVQCQ